MAGNSNSGRCPLDDNQKKNTVIALYMKQHDKDDIAKYIGNGSQVVNELLMIVAERKACESDNIPTIDLTGVTKIDIKQLQDMLGRQ